MGPKLRVDTTIMGSNPQSTKLRIESAANGSPYKPKNRPFGAFPHFIE